ncbi:MAG: c-type cytochrome [Acidimicrobiia bacterium]
MKRLVAAVQVVAVLAALAFVVLLFANEPAAGPPVAAPTPGADGPGATVASPDGAEVFANRCASCHGRDGGGGLGPALADGRAVERFGDVATMTAVIAQGRGGMPAFETRLSEAEILAVAEYLRSL